MKDWLRRVFDRGHAKEREEIKRVVTEALDVVNEEREASRQARLRVMELEVLARKRR